MKSQWNHNKRNRGTLRRFILFIFFYWLYVDLILLLFRIGPLQLDFVVALGPQAQALDFDFLSFFDNGAESSNLPALESESSSASLSTYRNVIAAENEAEIYNRIRNLENSEYYNLPPQNNIGDYESLVREHFEQAINVDHYREIWDKEFQELQFLEKKGFLQDRLQTLLLNEQNIERIMDLSPYSNIRKEAYFFIEDKVAPVSNLQYAFSRNIMEGSLNSFMEELNAHDRQSDIYREFYRYFTDEEFRRTNGLPLP